MKKLALYILKNLFCLSEFFLKQIRLLLELSGAKVECHRLYRNSENEELTSYLQVFACTLWWTPVISVTRGIEPRYFPLALCRCTYTYRLSPTTIKGRRRLCNLNVKARETELDTRRRYLREQPSQIRGGARLKNLRGLHSRACLHFVGNFSCQPTKSGHSQITEIVKNDNGIRQYVERCIDSLINWQIYYGEIFFKCTIILI